MGIIKNQSFLLLTTVLISLTVMALGFSDPVLRTAKAGHWSVLQRNIGIAAMHMQVMFNNKVVVFDRTDFGASNLSLPNRQCRRDDNDTALKLDCTAHSAEYDMASNTFRPLTILTDTWCSSGALDPNGTLIQTGGYNDGDHVIRTFTPCHDNDDCDWRELGKNSSLGDRRWYATNQILPDGRVIVLGGRRVFSYEFFPKDAFSGSSPETFFLRFLVETRDEEENNLYPFLHLLPDGNLFVFANNRSISLDYRRNAVVREFPAMPGGDKRNYPSVGSSVLLPLDLTLNGTDYPAAEVMICGGAPPGAFVAAEINKTFLSASRTCGRIRVTDPNPKWAIEEMPMPRVLSDMILLPTGDVLLINGAMRGTGGWENADSPALNPVLYRVNAIDPTRRFAVLNPTSTPRMYHSTAVLLPDGRVLVGGSNPHRVYNFSGPYPTELSLEAFYPPYLGLDYGPGRASILTVEVFGERVSYGDVFAVTYVLGVYGEGLTSVVMVAPAFSTHALGMNQRAVRLAVVSEEGLSESNFKVVVRAPTTGDVAPPGYYMLFVVHGGIPSHAVWVKLA